jgi:hypothetical protein
MNPAKLAEREVTKAAIAYLRLRGWRCVRMQSGGFTNPQFGYHQIGEPGMPDWIAIYYMQDSEALILWIEMKKPGAKDRCTCKPMDKKPCRACRQKHWRETETQRGATVLRIDSLEQLVAWYEPGLGKWLHGPDGPRRNSQMGIFNS